MARGLGEALAARPRGALATGSALLAGTLALALGAPERLPAGPIQVEGGAAPAGLVVRTRDPRGAPALPADSRVYRIALDVIFSRLRADPVVERVEAVRSSEHADLVVTLAPDGWSERLAAVRRIAAGIDPGPLDVSVRGQIAELDERREAVGGELWRLEIAVLPLLVLVLVGALGMRMALAALGALAHAALARPPAGEMLGIAPATAGEAVAVSGAIGAVLAVVGGRTALTLALKRGARPAAGPLARGFALSTVALLLAGGALAAGGVILGGEAEPEVEVELYGALVAGGALGDLLLVRVPGMLLAARGRRAGVAPAG